MLKDKGCYVEDYPTREQINGDLKELLDEVKEIKTVAQLREFQAKYPWMTMEIDGELFIPDLEEIEEPKEYIRYESYGCLDYIYVYLDGKLYFDVWSEYCGYDFIDSATGELDEETYNKIMEKEREDD